MRIIRIVLLALLALAAILPQMASADEINTETNINTTLLYFSNLFSPDIAQANGGDKKIDISQVADNFKRDPRTQGILDVWKDKQMDKWQNLPKDSFEINASAYTSSADECGKSDGITSSGVVAQAERTIACPPEFPFGAKIKIANMGTFVCEDRGGAIKRNKFDIYMESKKAAFQFGRQHLIAQVVD